MNITPFYDLRLQMTNSCTLKCRHCFASSLNPKKNELNINEIKQILQDHLIPRGLKWLVMTGGEPLLRFEDCLELTRFCVQSNIVPKINTAGFVQNAEDKIRRLIDEGIETILLPLEASSSDLHDKFCGVDGVYKNTISIFKLIKKLGGISCLRVTIFNWNTEEIPKLLEIAIDIGINIFRIRPELPAGRAIRHKEYPTIEQIEIITKYLLNKQKTVQNTQIEFLNPHFQFLYSKKDNYNACSCGITKAFLTSDGNIKPCGFYKDTFGNIRKKSFQILWEQNPHPLLKRLRSDVPFKECYNCEYWSICKGGCPVVTYNDWSNFDGICRYCPIQNKM